MLSPHTNIAPKTRARQPRIVLNADDLPRIEALADGAMVRNPALADRLFDEINRARILPASKMPKDVIGIGSTATYRDETTGQEKAFTLVYPEDADIALDRVSVLTPIGVALLGLAEGAAFHWDTRANQRRTLTVIRVEQRSKSGES
ncbi:nucleoside diphosphate kinase regulator [Roseovarius sp. S4756]|uniref:nucleoside diphosphate kinase regulator n=1 Tax=Roseovarius maritimus TaxID=3342637 RepID=UPI00372B483E